MWGLGTGQRDFIGYGAQIKCSHCNNVVVEHIMVNYSYEIFMFVKEKYYGGRGSKTGDEGQITFMCPTCHWGFCGANSTEATQRLQKRLSKGPNGAKDAAQHMIEAKNQISLASSRFSISHTKNWMSKKNMIERYSYLKLLRRLGFSEIAGKLEAQE